MKCDLDLISNGYAEKDGAFFLKLPRIRGTKIRTIKTDWTASKETRYGIPPT
jgi:hypothetical protein